MAAGGGLMVVCGEPSGDAIAARALQELRLLRPELQVFGVGGDQLQQAGMEVVQHIRELSVMGLWDVIRRLPAILGRLKQVEDLAMQRRPDLLLLVDYPGFNLRLARRLHGRVPHILYYISPKYWAWKKGRRGQVARYADSAALIFPFEEADYRELDFDASYVGHPVLDLVENAPDRHTARSRLSSLAGVEEIGQEEALVCFCPGSRETELRRHLPVLADTAERLRRGAHPPRILLQLADAFDPSLRQEAARSIPGCTVIQGHFHACLRAADLALVASGTASLEAAALGTPHLVFYRMDAFSIWLAHRVVDLRWVSPVNISAGREVVPELLQNRANGKALADWCSQQLRSGPGEDASGGLRASVEEALGGPGASRRVAGMIVDKLENP